MISLVMAIYMFDLLLEEYNQISSSFIFYIKQSKSLRQV